MLDVNGATDEEFWVGEGGDQLIFQPLRGLLTIKCSAFLYLNVIHCFCAHSLFENIASVRMLAIAYNHGLLTHKLSQIIYTFKL